jgi:adenylate cyclase
VPHEIERKFLVDRTRWTPQGDGVHLVQGYLSSHPERVVRVRMAGDVATLTIKGKTQGISRAEYEYTIPVADAEQMLAELCERPLIDKHRYTEAVGGHTWEIDVFHGDNDGLVLAEVELASESQAVELPPWVTDEVSHDPRYFNANLLTAPFSTWKPQNAAKS